MALQCVVSYASWRSSYGRHLPEGDGGEDERLNEMHIAVIKSVVKKNS
jgi:hypothetical protein